jgi:hypothetical protein
MAPARNHFKDNLMTPEQQNPETTPQTNDALVAVDEIHSAAAFAEETLAQVGAIPTTQAANTDSIGGPKAHEQSEDEERAARAKFFANRLRRQKERGRAELEKIYVGAATIQKPLKFNDVNIAASAERFVGLIDLSVHTLNKRGGPVLGDKNAEQVLEQLDELISNYAKEAKSQKEIAQTLMDSERKATLENWLEPQFPKAALEANMHVKSPLTLKMIDAMHDWDAAILALTILHWNGKVGMSEPSKLREQERRLVMKAEKFAAKSLTGLRKKLDDGAKQKADPTREPLPLAA